MPATECRPKTGTISGRTSVPDNHWLEAHRELRALHFNKSATYGSETDPLANFVKTGELADVAPERVAILRTVEKLVRALNMIDAGKGHLVAEYPDVASLALCCEALRRRRLPSGGHVAEAAVQEGQTNVSQIRR